MKVAALDQIVKWWMISFLQREPGYLVKITSFFDLVYSWNYGISFGILSQYRDVSNKAFLGLNILITAILWYILLTRCKTFRMFTGYSFIVGGALGNIFDRIFRGAVFDFISLHYDNYYFAAFNIADSAIFIGVVILIYDQYKTRKFIAEYVEAAYNHPTIDDKSDEQLSQEYYNEKIRDKNDA